MAEWHAVSALREDQVRSIVGVSRELPYKTGCSIRQAGRKRVITIGA
jgi:hypothetical protein